MTSVTDSTSTEEVRRTDDRLGRAVADMLERRAGGLSPEIRAAIVDNLTRQTAGHTCTETTVPPPPVPGLIARLDDISDPDAARRATAAMPFVSVGRYFYAQRQFLDELSLAERVQRLVANDIDLSAHVPLERLEALLPPLVLDNEPPYAVPLRIGGQVLRSNFNLLIGGPGTGKTYSLTRYLALLVEALLASTGAARIAVCAPTGKAADRASEMLAQFCTGAALAPEVAEVLRGVVPTTIHTLLRPRRDAPGRFRHDALNQLDIDVLVVDEMSMVAVPLMARLLEAVPDGCRVLLVGDEAQLESIDVGAVLAELSGSRALGDLGRVGRLTHVFRQDAGSSINDAAYAIRAGRIEELTEVLDRPDDELEWVKVAPTQLTDDPTVKRIAELLDPVVEAARSTDSDRHAAALAEVTGVKVLCGPRNGPAGVNAWNRAIAQQLGLRVGAPLPPGTPVLVTVNSPLQHLVNGSVGLVVKTPVGVRVAFAPSNDGGAIRYFTFAELPPSEVCFAMTVHKSQGSEYDRLVVTVLPHEDSPLLTRELLYTALTRAKRHAVLIGTRDAISTALARPTTRTSGLAWIVDQLAGHR